MAGAVRRAGILAVTRLRYLRASPRIAGAMGKVA
jgi:hypothetical protein